jgi:2-amino-4-hydroxy-6-hydroxymethyldihydropteridine diphosphokinase / dihydropteroate synthase
MAILNLTPDSFSDGGVNNINDLSGIAATIRQFIAGGATIVDIGGQSTRPKADLLTAEEELARILPVIKHIRLMPEAQRLIISVDTFYSRVAREAVAAGADVINDVSGGLLDGDMLSTVASLGKTIILMHMRGTPLTMTNLTNYPMGLLEEISTELQARVKAAEASGIPRWRIILDPGIGFAKNQSQNLELLRRLDDLRAVPAFKGLPWLVGTSRKGFIGKITGISNARERIWGTAAAVTASIAGGADIIRVHDVTEMSQVAKMADAIYRTNNQS